MNRHDIHCIYGSYYFREHCGIEPNIKQNSILICAKGYKVNCEDIRYYNIILWHGHNDERKTISYLIFNFELWPNVQFIQNT